jgi:hypothetical protein
MPRWNPFTKTEEKPPDQSKSEADELVERFSAVIEEKIKPFSDTVTALKSKWDDIEKEALKGNEPPPRDPATITDEEKRESRERANFALGVISNARITEMECIQSLQGQWEHLIPEFKRMCAETSVDVKARPDYAKLCQNGVDQLIGRAARQAGVRTDASGKFFIEDSASKTGGEDSPLNDIPAWQGDDRVESASDTLAKLKIDPKKFSEDFKNGRLN